MSATSAVPSAVPPGGRSAGRLRRRLHRLEPAAISGVMSRDVTNFKSFWKTTTFSSVLDPTIYLLAFGLGLGTLVAGIDGIDYVQFVGTGMVATAVLFSSAFSAMYGVFIKHRFQHTYDAILAAPVDVEELVTAEVTWLGVRAGVYGVVPLFVTMLFGLEPTWGILLVPFIGMITGFAFAGLGVFAAALVSKIDHFSYIQSALITPLFLVSGTFFPIDDLPQAVQIASWFNPLFHCVELVRDAVFDLAWSDLIHLVVLIGFAILSWRLAIWRMEKRLID
jgi:lipooligosaccharide transport system permease protein